MESTWTIAELAAAAAAALGGEPAQVNGRVRDMPNERLIRWYTTIGLVDPPSARRGRIALYGRRHLLQLVAVKRRQAAGRTIAQIQMELTGATDDTLQSIARVPGTSAPPSPDPDPGAGPGPAGGLQRRFWTPPPAAPRDLAVAPGPATRTTARSRTGMGETTPSPLPRAAPALVHGVRLAPGVTLMLDADALEPEDLAAIGIAARPLLDALRRLGLPDGSARTPPSASAADAEIGADTSADTSADTGTDAADDAQTESPTEADAPSEQFPTGRST